MVEIGVLGRLRASIDGVALEIGGPRQRALLARLAVDLGASVSVDALMDAVWGDDLPSAAERTFRTYVARLRKALSSAGSLDASQLLRSDGYGYRLDDALTIRDSDRFGAAVALAREELSSGGAGTATEVLAGALASWEGDAYAEFADRPWAQAEALRLEELRTVARELEVRALLDAGRAGDATTRAEALAVAHPLRESVARLLVLARYRAERHADALDEARAFRERLAEETGLDPSPQLELLTTMVLERDPRLDRPVGGRRLRGYVLHEVIATTPLGPVHRAEQPSIGREVAITVLPADRADDDEFIREFEARAQQVAGVEHPHIAPLYDYWREPGAAYLVTRLPAGGTLAQRLASGSLEAADAVRVVQQVGRALASAHEQGVAHGAVGPDAVQLDARGDASLWAFPLSDGTAHPAQDLRDLAGLVRTLAGATADGGVRTEVLPDAAMALVEQLQQGDGEAPVATVAGFLRELESLLDTEQPRTITLPDAAPPERGPNPFRGLAAFRETDAEVFFGREALAETVRARLARRRLVAVVGPSGSGKSSLVRAGVLPALRADGCYVTTMVPASRPLAELAVALSRVAAVELPDVADALAADASALDRVIRHALPGPDGDLVLVVDQLEELFTISDPDDRDLLLRALAAVVDAPSSRVRVIVTLRADFLGRVLDHPVAGQLVDERTVMVPRLTNQELHRTVVGPAEVAGVVVEPALATAVVADASRSIGSLPMLQFALTEVFSSSEDGRMTLEAYQRIGGIEGVLGQRAEEILQSLEEPDHEAARQLFSRLVVPNDDGPPTRRRALQSELSAVPDRVVRAFGEARLLLFDNDQQTREPTVEVTHEALFRSWPRLVEWIEQDVEGLRLLGHLTAAAAAWEAHDRDDADLYRGARLEAALAFARDRRSELTDGERRFLSRSVRVRDDQVERERRGVRRLQGLTTALGVGLVVALVAGGLAFSARGREATTAAAAQADALAFAASATVDDDLELATLLALEAYAASPDVESQRALLDVLGGSTRVVRILSSPPGLCGSQPPLATSFAVMARGAETPFAAHLYDFEVEEFAVVPLVGDAHCPVPDRAGRLLFSGDQDTGVLRTFEVATGEVVAELSGWRYPGLYGDVFVSPRDDELLVVGGDGGLRRVRTPDLGIIDDLGVPAGADRVRRAGYGEVGELVVVGVEGADQQGRAVVLDRDGEVLATTEVVPQLIEVALAEQLELVLTVDEDGVVLAHGFDGERSAVPVSGVAKGPMATDPTGALLAVATTAGVELVELSSMRVVGDPIGVDTTFGMPSWGPEGELLYTGPAGTVTADLDGAGVPVGEVLVEADTGEMLWPSPDGSGAMRLELTGPVWVSAASGTALPTLGSDRNGAVAALPDRRWAMLDLDTREFVLREGRDLVARTPLPDGLPEELVSRWATLRVDNGVAVATVGAGTEGPADLFLLAFDVDSGALVTHQRFAAADGPQPVTARALGPDRLVVSFDDQHAEVRAVTGEVLASRADVVGNGEFIGVAPGGGLIAAAQVADVVVVLDEELRTVTQLTGAASNARFMGFASDQLLVTRHAVGTTYLWELPSGRQVGRLFSTEGFRPYGIAVASDGPAVLQSTGAGITRIPLEPQAWFDHACSLVSRGLTAEELDAVVPGRTPLDPCGLGGV